MTIEGRKVVETSFRVEMNGLYRDKRGKEWRVKGFITQEYGKPWFIACDPATADYVHVMTEPKGYGKKPEGKFIKRKTFEKSVVECIA